MHWILQAISTEQTKTSRRHVRFRYQETHEQRPKLEQRQSTYHASLVVQALLEVPESVPPEVVGTLAQEGCQLGVVQALDMRMSAFTKHGPHILVLQLPVHLTCFCMMQKIGMP